jgi:hypothetical protein
MTEETNFEAARSLLRRALKEIAKGGHEKSDSSLSRESEDDHSFQPNYSEVTLGEAIEIIIEDVRDRQDKRKQSKEFI